MAKKIKFNLHCNGQKIANMESLRENFNLEDIVEHFQSGRLQRWLEAHGLAKELEKVKAICADDIAQIAKVLIKAFDIEISNSEEEEAVYDIQYLQKRNEFLQKIGNAKEKHRQLITEYHHGFYQLLRQILENPTDKILIKKNLQAIAEEYFNLVLLYRNSFVWILSERAPFALLLSFGIDAFEKLWRIGLVENGEEATACSRLYGIDYEGTYFTDNIKYCAEVIASLLGKKEIIDELVSHGLLINYTNDTEGNWQDLEPRSKRCLILSVSGGNVASMVADGEVTKATPHFDINGKFLIFDGLKFQTTRTYCLLYMEL